VIAEKVAVAVAVDAAVVVGQAEKTGYWAVVAEKAAAVARRVATVAAVAAVAMGAVG
jgi:hypothetical protein